MKLTHSIRCRVTKNKMADIDPLVTQLQLQLSGIGVAFYTQLYRPSWVISFYNCIEIIRFNNLTLLFYYFFFSKYADFRENFDG